MQRSIRGKQENTVHLPHSPNGLQQKRSRGVSALAAVSRHGCSTERNQK